MSYVSDLYLAMGDHRWADIKAASWHENLRRVRMGYHKDRVHAAMMVALPLARHRRIDRARIIHARKLANASEGEAAKMWRRAAIARARFYARVWLRPSWTPFGGSYPTGITQEDWRQ